MRVPSCCLHSAAKNGNVGLLRLLTQHPGFKSHEINARDRDGRVTLLLLKHQAVDLVVSQSALHLAAARGHLSAIVALKGAGADSSARIPASAMTPFDVAQDKAIRCSDSWFQGAECGNRSRLGSLRNLTRSDSNKTTKQTVLN